MKRLGIFVFFDRDGVVDGYVQYLLQTIRSHLTYLVTVCNGIVSEEGKQILCKLSDKFWVRENKGYDAMALKMAFTEYIGWDNVSLYDEVVFFNDTFYGPIYPWQEIFNVMDKKNVDFWGLTAEKESYDYYSNYEKVVPAHIQSYFCVFRKSVLCHSSFKQYWDIFDSTNWLFSDVTNKHEKIFTQFLEKQGFKWDVYVKASLFESADPGGNFNQYYYIAYELIRKYHCPVIKRKNFIMKHLTDNPGICGNDTAMALEFIQNNTEYDTNFIWDNLLRLYSMHDLRKTLNLNYIVSGSLPTNTLNLCAVVIWISFKDSLAQCIEYLKNLNRSTKIYIYSESINIIKTVQEQLQGWTISFEQVFSKQLYNVLLEKCKNLALFNQYIVFLHDVNYFEHGSFRLQQYSLLNHLWSNLLKNQYYLDGIIELLKKNERLGMLVAPHPVFGSYLSNAVEYKDNFFAFCCRGKAMLQLSMENDILSEPLFSMDSVVIQQLSMQFQQIGYYTACVMNTNYAESMYSHMRAILERILLQARRKFEFFSFDDYLDAEMLTYAKRFSRIMVYGAGECGYRASCILKAHGCGFVGFLVSDGQLHDKERYGECVFSLSEVDDIENCGIVVAIANPKAQRDVEMILATRNCTDIFFL